MVINVLKDKQSGGKLNFNCEENLNSDILLHPNCKFKGPVKVFGYYVINEKNKDIDVFADIAFETESLCDRCGKEILKSFDFKFKESFVIENLDETSYSYNGEKINLDKATEESIMANLPVQIVCKDKCKGLCPICGANLNEKKCKCKMTEDNPFLSLLDLKKIKK